MVGEYTPIQYLQLRLGARTLDDPALQDPRTHQAFFEVHAYF